MTNGQPAGSQQSATTAKKQLRRSHLPAASSEGDLTGAGVGDVLPMDAQLLQEMLHRQRVSEILWQRPPDGVAAEGGMGLEVGIKLLKGGESVGLKCNDFRARSYLLTSQQMETT